MQAKLSIWITARTWPAAEGGRGYEWELYNHDKPIAKSSPAHGDTYFYQKRSAIAAAIRMRSFCSLTYLNATTVKRICVDYALSLM